MTPLVEGVLQLIKSALTGEGGCIPNGFSVADALQLGKKHGIEVLLYHGGVHCGLTKADDGMQALYQSCLQKMLISERQRQLLEKILQLFAEKNIRILPLKGMILREMYPLPEMRWMGDADILIDAAQYPAIKDLLQVQGFTQAGRTDHEIAWHHSCLRLELHTLLVPERNRILFDYYGDGWQRAHQVKDNVYAMSPEDALIFLVAHAAKHYAAGGIGIRQFVDFWIYNQTYAQLDQGYILQELAKVQLDKFYTCTLNMLQAWFGDGHWDENVREMTGYIFASGSYGTHLNHVLAQGAKQQSRARRFWNAVFPGYGEMKLRYPVLGRWPVLLPFTWLVRGVSLILFHRNRIHRKSQDLQLAADSRTKELQKHFDMLGLRSNL